MTTVPPGVVVPPGSALGDALSELAREARMVFLAGLPGTGKSLLLHQIAHLAHARGRPVHRLQWDVARPPFEDSAAGRRYPAVAGVTHGIIRVAVGRWARHALGRWRGAHAGPEHLLIGETPLVGHRLVELARRHDDAVEGLLDAAITRFVIPVPSVEVRRHLEGERERRAASPVHEREREDANPTVLRDLWRELVAVAAALGLGTMAGNEGASPWDPTVYARVYETVLRHRRPRVLALDTILPTATLSVYDFRVPCDDLVPTPAEVERFIAEAATAWPDAAALRHALSRWYEC
jgi:hypothetical protein